MSFMRFMVKVVRRSTFVEFMGFVGKGSSEFVEFLGS